MLVRPAFQLKREGTLSPASQLKYANEPNVSVVIDSTLLGQLNTHVMSELTPIMEEF